MMTCRHESQGWVVSDLAVAVVGRAVRTGMTMRSRRRRAVVRRAVVRRGAQLRGRRTVVVGRWWTMVRRAMGRGRMSVVVVVVVVRVVWWMMHLLFFFEEVVLWRRVEGSFSIYRSKANFHTMSSLFLTASQTFIFLFFRRCHLL